MPATGRERDLSRHTHRVVEPALGEVGLQPAVHDVQSVTLIFRHIHPARDDGAAVVVRQIEPGAQGELVEETEVSQVARVDKALAVELGGLTENAMSEGGNAFLKRRGIRPVA
jgi:hypothetical protein